MPKLAASFVGTAVSVGHKTPVTSQLADFAGKALVCEASIDGLYGMAMLG